SQGAPCPLPERSHWPFQFGYCASSNACALVAVRPSAATAQANNAQTPVVLRSGMTSSPDANGRRVRQWLTTARPSWNLMSFVFQAPPGAPLRSGLIFSLSSSPDLSDLLDQPSRTSALGLCPSRFQMTGSPSFALTEIRMKVCGLVNLNSVTVPSRLTGFSVSNIANEWCASAAPP